MNAFAHPQSMQTEDAPTEISMTKRLSEFRYSKKTAYRDVLTLPIDLYDFVEFNDETRLMDVIIFKSMLAKLYAQSNKNIDCELIFVRSNNIKLGLDKFESLNYLVAMKLSDRSYAVDQKIVEQFLSTLHKDIRFHRFMLSAGYPLLVVIGVPLSALLIGMPMVIGGIIGWFHSLRGIKQCKIQQPVFEKILATTNSVPDAIRHSI